MSWKESRRCRLEYAEPVSGKAYFGSSKLTIRSGVYIATMLMTLDKGHTKIFTAYFPIISCPTVSVSCGGWEGGHALKTENAQSHENAQETRRVPQVGCTHC